MNCELCTDNITAYLDAELSAREADDLRRHVEACVPCRRELEDLRDSMQFIDARVTQLVPSAALWRNVQARITQLPAPQPRLRLGDLFRTRWAPAALAASIALGAGLGVWGYLERQDTLRRTATQYALEKYMDTYVRFRDGEEQIHRAPAMTGRLVALHEEFSENPFVNVAEQSPPNPFVIDQGRSESTR